MLLLLCVNAVRSEAKAARHCVASTTNTSSVLVPVVVDDGMRELTYLRLHILLKSCKTTAVYLATGFIIVYHDTPRPNAGTVFVWWSDDDGRSGRDDTYRRTAGSELERGRCEAIEALFHGSSRNPMHTSLMKTSSPPPTVPTCTRTIEGGSRAGDY